MISYHSKGVQVCVFVQVHGERVMPNTTESISRSMFGYLLCAELSHLDANATPRPFVELLQSSGFLVVKISESAEIAVWGFWKQCRRSSDISDGKFFFRRSLSSCDSSLKGMNVARYVIIPRNPYRSSLSRGADMFWISLSLAGLGLIPSLE